MLRGEEIGSFNQFDFNEPGAVPGGQAPPAEEPRKEAAKAPDIDIPIDPTALGIEVPAGETAPTGQPAEDQPNPNMTPEEQALRQFLGPKQEEPKSIELPEQVAKAFEAAGIKDVNTFLSAELKELREAKELFEKQNSGLNSLPPELTNMVVAAMQGDDWKAMASKYTSMDFSKPAEKLDKKTLISVYGDVKFTDEEWEEYSDKDGDPRIKAQIDREIRAAQERYNQDKENHDSYYKRMEESTAAQQKAAKESLTPQLADLNARGLGLFVKNGLGNQMMAEAVGPMFRNQDGSFKDDAALAFVLAKNYKMILEAVASNSFESGKESATLKKIEKSPATPRQGRAPADNGVGEVLKQKMGQLGFEFGQVPKETSIY